MENLHVSLVLEILGRPAEHVTSSLSVVVERLGKEKGVQILNKQIHPPVQIENSTLFTSFVEIEAQIDNVETLIAVLFGYMPSHVDILSPERSVISNSHLGEISNLIVRRLHDYDSITKNALAERNFVLDKLRTAAPKVFQEITSQSPPPQKEEKKSKKSKSSRKKSK